MIGKLAGRRYLLLGLLGWMLNSCTQLSLFERSYPIPGHRWESKFTPYFDCTIKDTASRYDVSLILRHRDLYRYNNIWLNITVTDPNQKTYSFVTEKQLGTNENGWLGSGMDDIYEHRISLTQELVTQGISFRKPGRYRFQIKQIMREDPLEYVMNVGIRLEKKP